MPKAPRLPDPGGAPEEARAALRLYFTPGLGSRRTARLLRALGSARRVLEQVDQVEAMAGAQVARALLSRKVGEEAAVAVERSQQLGFAVLPWGSSGFPQGLRQLPDPPPVLFASGDLGRMEGRRVAVVGSRETTPVGRRMAERLGRDLSRAGVTVWSGLALGVDAAAHRGALEGAGGTAAVLGTGLDRCYPATHRALLARIRQEGLAVSEFPPGTGALSHHFPRRNRILAALAEAVVVVEASPSSGALITADHAQDLGRPVLAVPGSVESEASRGTNALLRDGAGVVVEPRDVLDHLNWGLPVPDLDAEAEAWGEGSPSQQRILAVIGRAPISLERILEVTGDSPSKVLANLTELELEDRISRVPEGWIRGPGRSGDLR
jgi:DNA processing protein